MSDTSCESYAGARSERWDQPVPIQFTNRADHPVTINWIDYHGIRQPSDVIPPGGVYRGQTFITHPFEFQDAAGRCVEIVLPVTGVKEYDIGEN